MGNLRIEEYVPAGEIVATNLSHDLPLFTVQYKNIDNNYLNSFKLLLGEVNELESFFAVTEEQKKLTVELYSKSDDFSDKLMFMKSYAKEVGLNFGIISIIMKQLRSRNIEGAIKNSYDVLEYYSDNTAILSIGNMPEGFLGEVSADLNTIKVLNDAHNSFLVNRKEITAKNKAFYDRLYRYISEICAAGKLIFKKDAVKRGEYTIEKIVSILQSSRKRKDGNTTAQLGA